MSAEKIKDGGPVHPIPEVRDADGNGIMEGWHGMLLRDWFAGQAMTVAFPAVMGMGPSDLAGIATGLGLSGSATAYDVTAASAFKFADAMLKAREAQS